MTASASERTLPNCAANSQTPVQEPSLNRGNGGEVTRVSYATTCRGTVTSSVIIQRRALRSKLLLYLSAVGGVAANENAELGAQFRLPRVGPNQAFVTMARGMLEKATAHKELLVKRGMSETLIDDITAAIEEFEQTLEATRAGRREHVGASADLRSVMAEISDQVKVVDGIVRYRFGDNAELMGAWASVHNVAGPFRSPPGPPGGGRGGPKGWTPGAWGQIPTPTLNRVAGGLWPY